MTTMPAVSSPAGPDRAALEAFLSDARARTLRLIEPLGDDDLRRQHNSLMSPILWDLGHIAHFEALWLTRNLDGPIEFVEMPGLFNPFEHPRSTRGELPLPGRAEVLALMADIRREVLARLQSADPQADPRVAAFVQLVVQHEMQHNETILQSLQLKEVEPYRAPHGWLLPAATTSIAPGAMARFAGGPVSIGTDDTAAAYDNERPRHIVELSPFRIDVAPVTNGAFAEFIEAGGYDQPVWWSEAGWAWRSEGSIEAPLYWERRGHEWWHRVMDCRMPVAGDHPVCHVSHYEAEAFARWAGKRLPTEFEWEAAATWDPQTGKSRLYPWGDQPPARALANVDQLGFGTAPVGAYRGNWSPLGCYGMIGDVWEWTSSNFRGYPGFQSYPYREYSEVFFGSEYKVLRGGSWATRPGAIRGTFRNWDYPIRRQIFSGFRCACDD